MQKRKILKITLSVLIGILIINTGVLAYMLIRNYKSNPSDDSSNGKVTLSTGDFDVGLFKRTFLTSEDEGVVNTVISPLSIKLAMAMATEGASADTRSEMQGVLGLDENSKTYYRQLLQDILNQEDITLNMANSVWSKEGLDFKSEYMDILEQYYYAEATSLDFSDTSSVDLINNWVEEKTEGKIDSILDSMNPRAILYLINAIYFDADWTEQFVEDYTQEKDFTLKDGSKVKADLMYMSSDFQYQENEKFQAVELPYGEEQRFVMRVYLPREGITIHSFVNDLTQEDINKWKTQFNLKEGDLELPKFKTEYSKKLNSILEALGIEKAFNEFQANFDNMIVIKGENVYISEVKHRTYIDVSERGTEAAATTFVGMVATGMPLEEPEKFEMIVDRPFFFTIDDKEKNETLFMGTILNPRE
jgi:serpin B